MNCTHMVVDDVVESVVDVPAIAAEVMRTVAVNELLLAGGGGVCVCRQ